MSKEDIKFLKFLFSMLFLIVIGILLMRYTIGDEMKQRNIHAYNAYYHGETNENLH